MRQFFFHFIRVILIFFLASAVEEALSSAAQTEASTAAGAGGFFFGTSTFYRAEQPLADWHRILLQANSNAVAERANSNRHSMTKILALTMDKTMRTDCSSSPIDDTAGNNCRTTMEWKIHSSYGRNKANCQMDTSTKWQPFSIVQEANEPIVGLLTALGGISGRGIQQPDESNDDGTGQQQQKQLLIALSRGSQSKQQSGPSAAAAGFVMASAEKMGQIGRSLNATRTANSDDFCWTKVPCANHSREDGEHQQHQLELDEAVTIWLDNGQRIVLNTLDLAQTYNDEDNSCVLSLAEFPSVSVEEEEQGPSHHHQLVLSIFPRKCLLLNLAARQLAIVPRKWPFLVRRRGVVAGSGGGSASRTMDNNGEGGALDEQQSEKGAEFERREVSEWLSFALSLI